MTSEANLSKIKKWASWVVPGVSFTGACIYTVRHGEFIPRLAVLGSLVLLLLWSLTWLALWLWKPRLAPNARLVAPGLQIHIFFAAAIGTLWFPLLLRPLQTQKVEIILDISHRMADDFMPPGTTKFEAAKAGVLEVLRELEGNNMEVALRLVEGIEYGKCDIRPETSLAVDFTRDFDRVRQVLSKLKPRKSEPAPVVNAIDFSIDHYLAKRVFDQKFYLYSFIGGDDTCGEHLGTYLTLPMVKEHTVDTQLFLIILRGTEEERTLASLPNANLTYAESAAEVKEIVQTYNRIIVTPTPTATRPPLPAVASGSTPTETGTATLEPLSLTDTLQPGEPAGEEPQPEGERPADTRMPVSTSSPTALPPPTKTLTKTPSLTPVPPTRIPTKTPSATPIPSPIPTAVPSDTPTNPPPTPTDTPTATLTLAPTSPVVWTALPSQPDVFSTSCFLRQQARVYAQFYENQARISSTLVSPGRNNQALELDFSDIQEANWNYAGWEVWLGVDDGHGIDLSTYSSLVFYIKGSVGGEEANVYLMMPVTDSYQRFWKDVELVTPVTTSWRRVEIPLSYFASSQEANQQVDLTRIQRIQFLFEWYPEPRNGTLFVDDLCVN